MQPTLEAMTHHLHGKPSRWWSYSETLAMAQLRDRTGRRLMLPAVKSGSAWYWQAFPLPLPLYGAAELLKRPDAPVLVLEGEAAAEAARAAVPDHVCVTWPGGRHSVERVGVTPLAGRDVALRPSDDGAGTAAMMRLAQRLQGCARSVVLDSCSRPA